eukprot:15101425-Alexandrium_andersonii.AAC.1
MPKHLQGTVCLYHAWAMVWLLLTRARALGKVPNPLQMRHTTNSRATNGAEGIEHVLACGV